MIPLEEAQKYVLGRCPVVASVKRHPNESLGLVLAAEVMTTEAVPPFANTAMDGFAVRASDTQGAPKQLKVVDTLAAGAVPQVMVQAGEAIRIMTGAPMPPGADAVIMVELTSVEGDQVMVEAEVPEGNHVRNAGEDLQPGQIVFAAGLDPGASWGAGQHRLY